MGIHVCMEIFLFLAGTYLGVYSLDHVILCFKVFEDKQDF